MLKTIKKVLVMFKQNNLGSGLFFIKLTYVAKIVLLQHKIRTDLSTSLKLTNSSNTICGVFLKHFKLFLIYFLI